LPNLFVAEKRAGHERRRMMTHESRRHQRRVSGDLPKNQQATRKEAAEKLRGRKRPRSYEQGSGREARGRKRREATRKEAAGKLRARKRQAMRKEAEATPKQAEPFSHRASIPHVARSAIRRRRRGGGSKRSFEGDAVPT
jgi:hypothetical protein